MFDAHLPVQFLDDVDLDNLAYFGVKRAVLVMTATRSYESSEAVCDALTQHIRAEAERVSKAGIRAVLAAGMLPQHVPDRAFPEYYARLEGLAAVGKVQVIGPIGWGFGDPWEADLFRRHATIAQRHGLPIYVQWGDFSERAEVAMDEIVASLEIERDRLWFVNVPLRAARELAIVQRPMSIAVPPDGLDVEELAYWVGQSQLGYPLLLGSSLDVGAVDVTALARVHHELGLLTGSVFAPDTSGLM